MPDYKRHYRDDEPQRSGLKPEMRTLQIPLTDSPWATFQVPYPMTDEAWEEMMSFLKLMKRPLTVSPPKSESTEEPT